jgi:hypothetical protein
MWTGWVSFKPYSTQSSKNLLVNMGAIIKLSCNVNRVGELIFKPCSRQSNNDLIVNMGATDVDRLGELI